VRGSPPDLSDVYFGADRHREWMQPDICRLSDGLESSRIRPANDRETSRNDGNGWSIESAGQEPDSGIAAGSETRLENTLKVETRVRTPLGLRTENPWSWHGS
jgi:hypothetical protein